MRQTLNLHLPGDIDNLLRGLASLAADMPQGEYRRGYQAALTAVGVSLGMEQERAPEPSRPVRVFEGIEDTPWAIRAFANVGGGMMDTDISIFNFATGEYETGVREVGPQHVPQDPTVQNLYKVWIALGLSPELAALRCLVSWIGIPHDETVGAK